MRDDYSHIIWDWNGTLLNDLGWCMVCINKMLKGRGLPELNAYSDYRRVFRFPVQRFYQAVGFDFDREPFEVLAQEYMALYHGPGCENMGLHQGALALLQHWTDRKKTQVVLSASAQHHLDAQVRAAGIDARFQRLLGIGDIYARSKVDIGKAYMAEAHVRRALLIGDTTHDREVAQALGADCLLVAQGHQNIETLQTCNVPVFDTLDAVLRHIG